MSIADKVRDEDGNLWWILSLYPELNSVLCITTDETKSTRKTFRPDQLTHVWTL